MMGHESSQPVVIGVIQARMASTRCPGKVLRPLQGTPLLMALIERIRQAECLNTFVVATSWNATDDVIAETLRESGVTVVRGPEDDVLARYLMVLDDIPTEYVVRITADNPLSDPRLLDMTIRQCIERHLDYAYMNTTPVGTACDVFRSEVLRLIAQVSSNSFYREHLNAYIFDNPDQFRWEYLVPPVHHIQRPDIRVTIDTPEDFQWVEALLSQSQDGLSLSVEEIIRIADHLTTSP